MGLLFLVFFLTFIISTPISFSLGVAGTAQLLFSDYMSITVVAARMYSALDSFPLLSIPLFVLMGHLMECSGVLVRLVDFLTALLGHVRGGLAYVNILNSMLFAGVSGTAVSDIAGLGYIEIRMMEKGGYPKDFSVGITAASSILGPIIPPSVPMVIFVMAVGGGLSIGGVFAAGIIPGLLMAGGMALICYFLLRSKSMQAEIATTPRVPFATVIKLGIRSLPVLFLPVLTLGGILSGMFTVTETAAVSVVYALVIGFFFTRELRIRDIPLLVGKSAVTMGTVAILLGAGNIVSYSLTMNQAPIRLGEAMISLTSNPYVFMLIISAFLLCIGCVLDAAAAIVMLAPTFYPIAMRISIPPYTFALCFVLTLQIGLLTPPVGVILFLASSMSNLSIQTVVKKTWPYVVMMAIIVLVVIFFPSMTVWMPRVFGL